MDREPEKSLVRSVSPIVRPVVSPRDLVEAHKELTEVIKIALEDGRDYGKIPGTDKPTLLKPGAERLMIAFGCHASYSTEQSEIDHDREVKWTKRKKTWVNRQPKFEEQSGVSQGLYRYVIRCELVRNNDGVVISTGIGSCSTLEGKFIDRPRDVENTVLKMAQKRALVATVVNGFGLSDRFAQDLEDMSDGEPAVEESKPSPAERAHKAANYFKIEYGIPKESIEKFIGTQENPIPIDTWGQEDLDKLTKAQKMIMSCPEDERTAKAKEIFKC